ncbi:2-amino-4-hydroxy-6-hydroxymethyldihydropteridine diphosphokinase [Sphingobacterium griseoflavum]|uniref:2-amino-4-hydroxy-6-hydroxymethyldihydropteridine pyrophosphokinase n=1 Tax=Sphingobacterium griseoflavum TaxID=1474952 RepID=A0ABQ3HYL1_9SPHI|nr:2-amino-4-hydroxy-6-hydroxymethyldihydropteridine diphosphokinase [Sphingobacterium griseoflavum]GHE47647.1 hypothetical protein GCM10017764_33490 [Sphingobacterium griseoflavum]
MNDAFILLGANLGEPLRQLHIAARKIEQQVGTIQQASSIYSSAAWGVLDQPPFLNQVLLISTRLSPPTLLKALQQIESDLGRVRLQKWGARLIDIDILYYNSEIIAEPNLSIPHPYIPLRKFTLMPLVEIAPTYIHPVNKRSNEELLAACNDSLPVHQLNIAE